MHTWKFRITPNPDEAVRAQGYVRADNAVEAITKIGHQDAILTKHSDGEVWPGPPAADVTFSNGYA